MKKILSMLLSLIMCLGVFISCGDETESSSESPSSSESFLNSESSSEESEKQDIYYDELSELCYISGWNSMTDPVKYKWVYQLFTNYEELAKFARDEDMEKIDATIFDDYVVFEALNCCHTPREFERVGYRDLTVNGTVATFECDRVEFEDYDTTGYPRAFSNYYIIPRSEFGNVPPESITKIIVNVNTLSEN